PLLVERLHVLGEQPARVEILELHRLARGEQHPLGDLGVVHRAPPHTGVAAIASRSRRQGGWSTINAVTSSGRTPLLANLPMRSISTWSITAILRRPMCEHLFRKTTAVIPDFLPVFQRWPTSVHCAGVRMSDRL